MPGGADEIARLATTMNGMLDRLEAGRDRQRRFISDASHELRSPVASIRQQAEVARAHPNVTAASELADVVLQDVERLQGLVDDLLVLARLDEGAPAELSDVDVDDLVLAEAAWLRSAGTLDVDTRGVSATRVRIDRRQLTRVVHNLVTNAARHARAKIVLSTGERGAIAWLVVADDGPGIAEGDRERVFERFVRSDEGRARDEGGSGLGLAIVYEVVTHYGGSVTLATSELGGLAARVELPFGQATG